jgi:coenzyme F420-reducing hydrogenase gamma subunit
LAPRGVQCRILECALKFYFGSVGREAEQRSKTVTKVRKKADIMAAFGWEE